MTRSFGALAIAFGLLTLVSGGLALFGGARAAQIAGQVVPLVLWFNFISGAAYVAAGWLMWRGHPMAAGASLALALAVTAVFLLLMALIATGTAHEPRTVAAMAFRSLFWLAAAYFALRSSLSPAAP